MKPTNGSVERLNRELDALFTAYSQACPEPEASPDFMPRLWQSIEARRSPSYNFGRWTRAIVTAAAAICLLLGLLQTRVPSRPAFYSQTYIESLAEETGADSSASSFEELWADDGGASLQ